MKFWLLACILIGFISGNLLTGIVVGIVPCIVYGCFIFGLQILAFIWTFVCFLFIDRSIYKKIDTSDNNLAKIANKKYGNDLAKVQAEFDRLRDLTEYEKYKFVKSLSV